MTIRANISGSTTRIVADVASPQLGSTGGAGMN
jgi:hypothetical protein